ncbi:MAG: SGNH/GDSL hydrolase family protein [Thermoleophilia bacterium]|nr:SGNH/GDSL hydrolase family protein [Thermoleophilia bacterium]
MRIRALLAGLVAAVVWASAASGSPPLPNSIASIGDSITRATNVCCWYGDHPAQSWSTGGGYFDGVSSHYERLRALTPSIRGNNYNNARAGARMADAPQQAQAAVAQGTRYVTILMGANDVCTSSPAAMTSVEDFTAQFSATMNVLAAGLPPGALVFVSSIPNVYRLWQVLRDNAVAQLVWRAARICQSMLSPFNMEEDRRAVLERERAFNEILGNVCAQYAFCRFDGHAVFDYPFASHHVSRLDFFHPSLAGQATLATLTWSKSWWGSS